MGWQLLPVQQTSGPPLLAKYVQEAESRELHNSGGLKVKDKNTSGGNSCRNIL